MGRKRNWARSQVDCEETAGEMLLASVVVATGPRPRENRFLRRREPHSPRLWAKLHSFVRLKALNLLGHETSAKFGTAVKRKRAGKKQDYLLTAPRICERFS